MYSIIKKNFKNILKKLNISFFSPIALKIKRFEFLNNYEGWLIYRLKNYYLSIHLRPKFSKDFKNENYILKNDSDYCVIIQGPIKNIENFVKETILIYLKIFPNTNIIISTWSSNKEIINLEKKYKNIKVIINQVPNNENFGKYRNTDFQILSTYNGIIAAKSLGAKYILKTRTDWRIYKNNTLNYLYSLLNQFPPNNKIQQKRILVTSMTTCKYRIYGVTDTLQFGHIDDLLIYWNSKNYYESLKLMKIDINKPIINDTPVISEIFLCSRYLNALGHHLKWTLKDYWNFLKDYFCVIDADSLDLIWNKYDDSIFEKRYYRSYATKSSRCIEFSDWISLINNENIQWEQTNYKEKWVFEEGKLKQKQLF